MQRRKIKTTTQSVGGDAELRTPSPRRWVAWLSWSTAALLFAFMFSLLRLTAGVGGLVTGVAVALAFTWAKVWRRGIQPRGQLWTAALLLTLVTVVWDGVSFGRFVMVENGDTVGQRMTTWGRDHGLGRAIDWAETVWYNDPPSKQPAKELTLAIEAATTTTAEEIDEQVTTTTEVPPPQAPEALTPPFEPLAGEGQWVPVMQANGMDAMWATSVRPVAEFGGIVATVVVIDQTYVRVGLFNGRAEPEGDWARDDKVPMELWPALMGAMNSGFRLESSFGGYVTEGKVVQELVNGRATVAIDRAGKMFVGELGRDFVDDGSWLSMRQNLVLLVDHGQSGVERGDRERVFWGAHSTGETYVNRSALCELEEGRIAYIVAGPVNAEQMASVLINVGCVTGVQLDINDGWPNFTIFPKAPDGLLLPQILDRRMGSDPMRFVTGASRDFFAFFDATLLPSPSILDV